MKTVSRKRSMRKLLQAATRCRCLRRDASGFLLPARRAGFRRRQFLPQALGNLCLDLRRSFPASCLSAHAQGAAYWSFRRQLPVPDCYWGCTPGVRVPVGWRESGLGRMECGRAKLDADTDDELLGLEKLNCTVAETDLARLYLDWAKGLPVSAATPKLPEIIFRKWESADLVAVEHRIGEARAR